MIREVLPAELRDVGHLGFAAHEEGLLPGFDLDAWVYHWRRIYGMAVGRVWGFKRDGEWVGAMGAVAEADLYTGLAIAREAFWYVDPRHRGLPAALQLLGEFESWAALKGCVRQYITHHDTPQAASLEALYRRRGYHRVETTYVKEV